MSWSATLAALESTHTLLNALAEKVDEPTLRAQHHPDLSPLGWHLGHCVYIECLWLHERVRGDDRVTAPLAALYTPPHTPKPQRGRLLPPRDALLEWSRSLQTFNRDWLANLQPPLSDHELFADGYLPRFLLQHHSQHYETMLMVLTERALAAHPAPPAVREPLQGRPPSIGSRRVPGGRYRVGGERPEAFDNELPAHHVALEPFDIAARPVSNAEYLGFMEAGGYDQPQWWNEAGWAWRRVSDCTAPNHWRGDDDGHWYGVGVHGACPLAPDEPVAGLNHYEASAYAAWAGARLPHEYQWEAACRLGLLEDTGRVWEWCANTFHPYEGFEHFPYPEYSTPWFDGNHFVLRGASPHTRPAVKRPSFRNFYEPDKRHIFAGLRLVYP